MPITYRKDIERNYVHVEWIGEITLHFLEKHLVEFFNDPFVISSARDLTDVSKAELNFNGSQFESLINQIVIPLLAGRARKTAIVVQRPDQFGVARQYNVFADSYSVDKIFYDCDSALKWLLENNTRT